MGGGAEGRATNTPEVSTNHAPCGETIETVDTPDQLLFSHDREKSRICTAWKRTRTDLHRSTDIDPVMIVVNVNG